MNPESISDNIEHHNRQIHRLFMVEDNVEEDEVICPFCGRFLSPLSRDKCLFCGKKVI